MLYYCHQSITIYQLHCKSVSTSHHSKLLIVITMVAYIVCSLGDMIQMILRFKNKSLLESDRLTEFELYLVTGKGALYYLGNATFFMSLLMRIRKSFQVSKCAMGYLSLLLVLSVTFSILYRVILIVAMVQHEEYYNFYTIN